MEEGREQRKRRRKGEIKGMKDGGGLIGEREPSRGCSELLCKQDVQN